MQMFVIIKNVGIMINADVNAKNVMLESIQIIKIVNAERLIGKLVEECSENIDGNKMIYNSTLNDYEKICNSCIVYIVLLAIFFIISISISSTFIYLHWYLQRGYTETTIY